MAGLPPQGQIPWQVARYSTAGDDGQAAGAGNNPWDLTTNLAGAGGVDWSQYGYNGGPISSYNAENGQSYLNSDFSGWLDSNGYTPGEAQTQLGSADRWMGVLDKSGNLVQGTDYYNHVNDNQFWTAAMLAGGFLSGGIASGSIATGGAAANAALGSMGSVGTGAVSGAVGGFGKDGTLKSTLTGAALGAAGGYAKDYVTSTDLWKSLGSQSQNIDPAATDYAYENQMDQGSGPGLSSNNAPIPAGPATPPGTPAPTGNTPGPALDGKWNPATGQFDGTTTSSLSSNLGNGAKSMGILDWINAGTTLYSAYQNHQAQQGALNAANNANDIAGQAAMMQSGIAADQWDTYKNQLLPGMLTDAETNRKHDATTWDQTQADRTVALGQRDAGIAAQGNYLKAVNAYNNPDELDRRMGGIRTDAMGGYADLQAANDRRSARMGLNPASAAAQAMAQDAMVGVTGNMTGAMNQERGRSRDAYMAGLKTYSDMTAGASGSLNGTGSLGMQAGLNSINGSSAVGGSLNGAASTAGGLYGSSATSAFGGANAMNNYANIVGNGMFSTLGGMGFGALNGFNTKPGH